MMTRSENLAATPAWKRLKTVAEPVVLALSTGPEAEITQLRMQGKAVLQT